MTALLPPKCYPTECDQVLRLTRMNLVPQGFLLCPALTVSGLLRLLLIRLTMLPCVRVRTVKIAGGLPLLRLYLLRVSSSVIKRCSII